MTEQPTRAIIYTRVSRDDSGEARSNERQANSCRLLAESREWHVVDVKNDVAISAYSGATRPAWDEVLAAVAAGEVDVIIAWHMDRITRSMKDLEVLIDLAVEKNVGVMTVMGDINLTTDMGRMIARILAAVSRAEVERKSARQKLANRQSAAEGKSWPAGWRAFGYTLKGEVIAPEAAAYRAAFDDVLAGRVSLREVARRWTEDGFRGRNFSKTNAGWSQRGVRFALLNPRYAGIATYLGEEIATGDWTPLISRDEHVHMKALLSDPSRRTNDGRGGRTPQNLLTSIATCERCGGAVTAGPRQGKPVYRCKKDCVGTPRAEADAYVLLCIELALETLGAAVVSGGDAVTSPKANTDELDALELKRALLVSSMLRGDISAADFDSGTGLIRRRIEEIELEAHGRAPSLLRLADHAEVAIADMRTMSLSRKRRLIEAVAEVTFKPRGRGRRNVPIEDQVEVWIRVGDDSVSAQTLRELQEDASAAKG